MHEHLRAAGPIGFSLMLALPACAEGPPSPATARGAEIQTRDSAGVEIVEIPRALFDSLPEWRLTEEPILSIGEVDGEEPYVFGSVVHAVRFEDGGLAVMDGFTFEVRVFDAEGRFVTRFGRAGDGPGEFSRPVRQLDLLSGDRIGVWDTPRARVTIFERDGTIVREYSTRECAATTPQSSGAFGQCYYAHGFLGDGTLALPNRFIYGPYPEGSGATPVRPMGIGLVRDSAYVLVDSVRQAEYVSLSRGDAGAATRRPFRGVPTVATGLEALVVGRGDERDLRWRDPEGTLFKVFRLEAPRALTESDLAVYEDADWDRWIGDPDLAEELVTDMAPSETVPNYGDSTIVDTSGRLWLQDHVPYGLAEQYAPRSWTVLSREGRPLARATIHFPDVAGFSLQQIDGDAVTAIVWDSLEVMNAVVYGIERGR